MPQPLAICLEDLDGRTTSARYLRCVAVVGRQPGLRVDGQGTVLWKSDDGAACELWVSGDDKLILYRREGAPPVLVRREGRALDAPAGKPIVLLDQDRFELAGRRFRVHVHGRAPAVAPPSPLPETSASSFPKAAAAAVALSAALGAAGCKKDEDRTKDVEVRVQPPSVPVQVMDVPSAADVGPGPITVDATTSDSEPIEIRVAPPMVAAPMAAPESDVPAEQEAGIPALNVVAATPEVAPGTQDAGTDAQGTSSSPDAAEVQDAGRGHRRDASEPIEVRERPPDMIMK